MEPQIENLESTDLLEVEGNTYSIQENTESNSSIQERTIEDSEGIERVIHTLRTKGGKNVDVIFYSPGELPFSEEALAHKNGFIFGQQPHWRTEKDWNTFIENVRNASEKRMSPVHTDSRDFQESINDETATIFVQSGLHHLLDMAFTLGVDSPQLREMRQMAAKHEISDEANDIIDGIIAANMFDENGDLKQTLDYEGEVLILRMLMGDSQAQEMIISRKIAMIEHEDAKEQEAVKQRIIRETKRLSSVEVEPLKLGELVAVHLTKYPPRRKDDHWEILSRFDATDWKDARQTIHFALNHAVASHSEGEWESSPYAVISPLDRMIEQNGKPAMLNTVDTYFEMSPGSTLEVPEGSWIVQPGGVTEGNLFEDREGNIIHVKSSDLTPSDITHLIDELSEERLKYDLNQKILSIIGDHKIYGLEWVDVGEYRDSKAFINQEEFEKLYNLTNDQNYEYLYQKINVLDILSGQTVSNTVETLFKLLGIDSEKSSAVLHTINRRVQAILKNQILRLAVDSKISEMGYTVQSGGMYGWGNALDVTEQTARLGIQLGVNVGIHNATPSQFLEEKAMYGGYKGTLEPKLKEGAITARARRDEWDYFLQSMGYDLSRANKRLLYAMGVL